jgi:hypothetical protein
LTTSLSGRSLSNRCPPSRNKSKHCCKKNRAEGFRFADFRLGPLRPLDDWGVQAGPFIPVCGKSLELNNATRGLAVCRVGSNFQSKGSKHRRRAPDFIAKPVDDAASAMPHSRREPAFASVGQPALGSPLARCFALVFRGRRRICARDRN